jgi:hypothetical protein
MIHITIEHKLEGDIGYRLKQLEKLISKGIVNPQYGTLPVQARLLLDDIMAKTPPTYGKTKNETVSVGSNDTMSRKVGEAAIRNDITMLFHPIASAEFRDKRIAKVISSGDIARWNALAPHLSGKLKGTRAVTPTLEFHRSQRNSRGRIPRGLAQRPRYVTLEPQQSALMNVIRQRLAQQGWTRAGWLKAYMALGGVRAPQWVGRHAPGLGAYENGLADPTQPYVGCWNATRWAKAGHESQRVVNNAMKRRAKSIERYTDKMAELALKGIATPHQEFVAQEKWLDEHS